MTHYCQAAVSSAQRTQLIDITSHVQKALNESGISSGICSVGSLHTTAGITVNENADPSVVRDIIWKLEEIVPRDIGFHHAEGNSDSHIKASMMGLSVQVPVQDARLVLGTWQSIYFCEFDGPRNRRVSISIIGE